jgi:hypothetical protein
MTIHEFNDYFLSCPIGSITKRLTTYLPDGVYDLLEKMG